LGFGKLDLLEAFLQLVGMEQSLVQQRLQARAQHFALREVHPALQSLQHSFHGPVLPMVEGHAVDLHLAADFGGFAAFGPDRQHRLRFLRRRVAGGGLAFGFLLRRA
jgi:hypothetical protein